MPKFAFGAKQCVVCKSITIKSYSVDGLACQECGPAYFPNGGGVAPALPGTAKARDSPSVVVQ